MRSPSGRALHQVPAVRRVVSKWAVVIGMLGLPAAGATTEGVPLVAGVSPDLTALLARCAPNVHPETMAALVSAESRGHVFAIADAGPKHLPWSKRKSLVRSFYPASQDEAVRMATSLIEEGHTVSLGLGQVNDRNLPALGLSIQQVFEPCTNLTASDKIFKDFYDAAVRKHGPGLQALRAALSGYNSGDPFRGEKDGYVDLVFRQVGRPLALRTGTESRAPGGDRVTVPALSATAPSSALVTTVPGGRGRVRAMAARPRAGGRSFVMEVSDFSVADRIARGETDLVQ